MINKGSAMKKQYFMYMPEMSWMSHDPSIEDRLVPIRVTEAPLVVYNPIKLKNIDDSIPPSACTLVIYGERNWDAVNVYRS